MSGDLVSGGASTSDVLPDGRSTDFQDQEGVIMMSQAKPYPVALLHAMPRPAMLDTVSHPAYAGTGQVRALSTDGRSAWVMYDADEAYWLPRRELTVEPDEYTRTVRTLAAS